MVNTCQQQMPRFLFLIAVSFLVMGSTKLSLFMEEDYFAYSSTLIVCVILSAKFDCLHL